MVRILLVATARGAVDEMVRAVRAAGLRARTADLAPLALVRAAAAASRREEARAGSTTPGPARTEAVIDVGSDKVAVAVHTAGVPHFVRVAAGLGGDGLTQTLVSATGMEWDQAERLKREASLGLPVRPLSLASVVDGVAPGRAQKSAPTEPPTDDLVVPAALCLGAIA